MISIAVGGIKQAVRNSDDDTQGRHRSDGDRLFARQGASLGDDVGMQPVRAAEPAAQLIYAATFERAGGEIAAAGRARPPARTACRASDLTVSLGLKRRASAKAVFASSVLPTSA
jgi:hypothetical protein